MEYGGGGGGFPAACTAGQWGPSIIAPITRVAVDRSPTLSIMYDRRLVEQLLIQQAVDMGLIPPQPPPRQPLTPREQLRAAAAGAEAAETATARTAVMAASEQKSSETMLPFSGIFAVGDNPRADVRGANAALHPWTSILVRTGEGERGGVRENTGVDGLDADLHPWNSVPGRHRWGEGGRKCGGGRLFAFLPLPCSPSNVYPPPPPPQVWFRVPKAPTAPRIPPTSSSRMWRRRWRPLCTAAAAPCGTACVRG